MTGQEISLRLEHLQAEYESVGRHSNIVDAVMDNIRNKSVILYGQGIFDINKKIHKIELLSRLSLPDGSIASPFLFMNILRQNGLSKEFDFIIIEQAFEMIKAQSEENPFKYSINVHKHTLESPYFIRKVNDLLEQTGVNPAQVIFEILEDEGNTSDEPVLNENHHTASNRLNRTLSRLRDSVGIELSVDDFPMGTNSMAGIRNMSSVDYVKLDGLWLLNMLKNCNRMYLNGEDRFLEMIGAVITDVRTKFPNVVFVAERVEDEYLFNLFRRIAGIEYFQGYFLGRPQEFGEEGFGKIH